MAVSRGNAIERGDLKMRANHSELKQLSVIEPELSGSELETVVGGGSAKTFQANANRVDPYKSFNFRVTWG
jgi:hypothetical protein